MAIDHEKEHECPAYGKVIDPELCYESVMCLLGAIKVESLPELREIPDIEVAKEKCKACPYSNMD